jgi:hypothetical protein
MENYPRSVENNFKEDVLLPPKVVGCDPISPIKNKRTHEGWAGKHGTIDFETVTIPIKNEKGFIVQKHFPNIFQILSLQDNDFENPQKEENIFIGIEPYNDCVKYSNNSYSERSKDFIEKFWQVIEEQSKQFLDDNCNSRLKHKHKIWFAHGLTFDGKVCLQYLPDKYKVVVKMKSMKKWLRLIFYENNKVVFEFRDSLNLMYSIGLGDLSRSIINMKNYKYGIRSHWLDHTKTELIIPDEYKEECNHNPHIFKNKIVGLDWLKPEWKSFKDNLLEYAKNDIICLWMITYAFYRIFETKFEFYVDDYYTTPSLAWGLYKSKFLQEYEIFKPKKQECQYMRLAYKGGLSDVFHPMWTSDDKEISNEFSEKTWFVDSGSKCESSEICKELYVEIMGEPKTEEDIKHAKLNAHKILLSKIIKPCDKAKKVFDRNLNKKIGIHADVVSSYPSSNAEHFQCGGRCRKLTDKLVKEENYNLQNDIKLKPGFYTVELSVPLESEFPVIGNTYNGAFMFPIGERHGVYSTVSLMFAKSQGYRIKIIDGIYFENDKIPSLRKFIIELFTIKSEEPKESALRTMSKLVLNGFYGYTALKPRKYKEYVIPAHNDADIEKLRNNGFEDYVGVGTRKMMSRSKYTDNKGITGIYTYLLGKGKQPLYYNDRITNEVAPQIGIFTVDYSREKLLRGILSAERIGMQNIYSDTDSVYLGGTLYQGLCWIIANGAFNDNKLGSWELDSCFDFMLCGGPKNYALRLANGFTREHSKQALKGINYRTCNSILCTHHVDISDLYKSNTIRGFNEVKTALPLILYRFISNARNIMMEGTACIVFNFNEVVGDNRESIEMFYIESNTKSLHGTNLKPLLTKRTIIFDEDRWVATLPRFAYQECVGTLKYIFDIKDFKDKRDIQRQIYNKSKHVCLQEYGMYEVEKIFKNSINIYECLRRLEIFQFDKFWLSKLAFWERYRTHHETEYKSTKFRFWNEDKEDWLRMLIKNRIINNSNVEMVLNTPETLWCAVIIERAIKNNEILDEDDSQYTN